MLQCLTDGTIEKHNQTTPIIQSIGDKFGLTVVDFYENGLSRENKTYFPSDVHPSKAGMMKIAEILLQVLETIHLHRFNHVVTAPTCTEQGYTTYTCDCGDSYVADFVDATGHTYENGICTGCGSMETNGESSTDLEITVTDGANPISGTAVTVRQIFDSSLMRQDTVTLERVGSFSVLGGSCQGGGIYEHYNVQVEKGSGDPLVVWFHIFDLKANQQIAAVVMTP